MSDIEYLRWITDRPLIVSHASYSVTIYCGYHPHAGNRRILHQSRIGTYPSIQDAVPAISSMIRVGVEPCRLCRKRREIMKFLPPNADQLASRMTKREKMALEFAVMLCRIRWTSSKQAADREAGSTIFNRGPSAPYIADSAVAFADRLLIALDKTYGEDDPPVPACWTDDVVERLSGRLCHTVMRKYGHFTVGDRDAVETDGRRFVSDKTFAIYINRNNGLPYHTSACEVGG